MGMWSVKGSWARRRPRWSASARRMAFDQVGHTAVRRSVGSEERNPDEGVDETVPQCRHRCVILSVYVLAHRICLVDFFAYRLALQGSASFYLRETQSPPKKLYDRR